jgi:ABC-2 type transport system ATP-binding protein
LNSNAVVKLNNVSVRYGKATAVDDVSLSVSPGSVYALLGRNGAGKTSLVRCLVGQQKPTHGVVTIFGRNVWNDRASLMSRVGIVPEDPDAPPEMTTTEIVRFCARLYPKWDAAGVAERLRRFDIPQTIPYGRLSKGQKRQVLLSIVLAGSPELLVLDDPTLGLDVVARKELFEELVTELAERGTTVVVTTHDMPGIEAIANRVGIMKEGRLVLDEDLETLKWRFRRLRYATAPVPAVSVELNQLETTSVRRWGNGTEAVVSNYDDVLLERFRSASGVRNVEVSPMSLEEIFIAVAGEQKGANS